MKSKYLQILVFVTISAVSAAQGNGEDSVKKAEQQSRITSLTIRIEKRIEKLNELETALADKTKTQEKAANEARESAHKNRDAAVKLSRDAENRKKAKKAERYADQARKNAKKARRASKQMEELKRAIEREKRAVAEDERSLSEIISEKSQG